MTQRVAVPVVILAGGRGTRLGEQTGLRPKPMVEIGGRPILWHVMQTYAHHGFTEFVICLGHQGEVIRDYFTNVSTQAWTVHLLETGDATMTGGRIRRAARFLGHRRFMATYGDGLASIDIPELLRFHAAQGRQATVTAVRPPSRFGVLSLDGDRVAAFEEKPLRGETWINGGYMVFEPGIEGFIAGDETSLEACALTRLAAEDRLSAFRHGGFWQCMDTVRDLDLLRAHWASGACPWKTW